MATIVSPYNPWREKLAASILGPIISGAITRGQQRADNAYNNKIAGQVMDAISGAGAGTPQAPSNLLGGLSVPQQSNNGWENAFRQNNNELANFDMSMAPLVTAQTAARRPNLSDMQSAFIRTLQGTRADPAAVRAIIDPYMQASIKDDYISQLSNAGNFDNYAKTAINANIAGALDKSVLTPLLGYAQHRQPHYTFQNINAGDKNITLATNPANGQTTPTFVVPIGLSPNTAATVDATKYVADKNSKTAITTANIIDATTRRWQDYNYEIQGRQLTLQEAAQKYQQEHPTHLPVTAADGNIYFYDPGNPSKMIHGIDQNGQPIIDRSVLDRYEYKPDASGTWYLFDKYQAAGTPVTDKTTGQTIQGSTINKDIAIQQIKYAQERNKTLESSLNDLRMQLTLANDAGNEKEILSIQKQIKDIQQQIADNDEQVRNLMTQYGMGTTPEPTATQPTNRVNPVPALAGDESTATTESDDLAPIVTAQPTKPAPAPANPSNQNVIWRHGMPIPQKIAPPAPVQPTPPQKPTTSRDAQLAFPFVTPDIIVPNVPNTVSVDASKYTGNSTSYNPMHELRVKDLPPDMFNYENASADKRITRADLVNLIKKVANDPKHQHESLPVIARHFFELGYRIID